MRALFANASNYSASKPFTSPGGMFGRRRLRAAGHEEFVKHISGHTRTVALLLIFLLACPAWMPAGTSNDPAMPDPGLAAPRDQQIQLGQKAVAEIYRQMPILPDDSALTRYVRSLGHKLQSVIPEQYNWPYQFHVVQQKEINAFALPGGPVFVNVGTIQATANEAELAGVIAHEMSHVYMQHSVKQIRKNTGPSLISGLGQILGAVIGGPVGALASLGGQLTGGIISMKYSRADESQADAVGAIIMYRAGYNPLRLAQFFQRLQQQQSSGGGPQFLSDHPDPGNRVQAVQAEIRNWPSRQFHDNSREFVQAKQEANNIRAYSAQQIHQMAQGGQIHNVSGPGDEPTGNGRSRGDASSEVPSGGFQRFQGQFSMEHPGAWQPLQGQQSGSVTFAPPDGLVQNAIAYGVVVSPFQPQNAGDFDDATRQLISSLQQQNPGMRAAGEVQKIRVNGVLGRSVDLLGQSPLTGPDGQPQRERDWLVTLPYNGGGAVSLIFVAPENDFARLRPTFEQMLKTFRLNQ
jgi:peptidase M48-like protein